MDKRATAWALVLFACSCGGSDGNDLFPPADDGGPEATPVDAGTTTDADTTTGDDASAQDATTTDGTVTTDASTDAPGVDAGNDAGTDAGNPCTSDKDCAPGTICQTSTGKCVSNTCTTPNQACPLNPADECCTRVAANICVPGNCCTNAQCSGGTPACVLGTCAACDAVVAPYRLLVDPIDGSDAPSVTGSGFAGGTGNPACALKTITRAIALLPSAPAQIIVDVTSTVGAGETFPIAVPANVLITGAAGRLVTVRVPGGANGFTLLTAGSAVANFVIDGQSGLATYGVVAQAGASSTLDGVEVLGFQLAGVRAEGGSLTITGGSIIHLNGTNQQASPGLGVTGTATVTITGTNQRATSFNQNEGAGIAIDQGGSITLTGTPSGTPDIGTVVANRNGTSGVSIVQAINAQGAPVNTINGLVAFKNGTSGIAISGGSSLKLRNSSLLSATQHGVHVTASPAGGLGSADISRIDLGDATSSAGYGKNVLQDPTVPNGGVGICLDLQGISLGRNLKAAGNVFGPGLNCATTNAILNKNACDAGSKGTVGIAALLDSIDATMCQVR